MEGRTKRNQNHFQIESIHLIWQYFWNISSIYSNFLCLFRFYNIYFIMFLDTNGSWVKLNRDKFFKLLTKSGELAKVSWYLEK